MKKMSSLELRAIDTLFFRDGIPFGIGEESWAKGIFPPYPSSIYGMLRSLWFSQHMDQFPLANQKNDPTLDLQISGFLPVIQGAPAFPAPLDLYTEKSQEQQPATPFQLHPSPAHASNHAWPYFLKTRKATKVKGLGEGALLSWEAMKSYLQSPPLSLHYHSLKEFTSREHKTGIARNPYTRTADEGKLYRMNMFRPEGRLEGQRQGEAIKDYRFRVCYHGLSFPNSGISRLGAEGKAVSFATSDFPTVPLPFSPGETLQRFKLYFATPAIFQNGPLPLNWLQERGLRVLTAATGRAVPIGGFDMQRRMPKPMRRAIPAGSVLYLELTNPAHSGLVKTLHQGSIYQLAPEGDPFARHHHRQGFGHCYLAKIQA